MTTIFERHTASADLRQELPHDLRQEPPPGTAQGQEPEAPQPGGLPRHDLPVLESYRGIAALMVLLTHVGYLSGPGAVGPWAGWLSRLDFGVALFFLLSGFLLFRPFVQASTGRRERVSVRDYLRRRYVRIYPAFVVALIGCYLITPAAREDAASVWLQTLFLVQNYNTGFGNQLHGLVQTWSLGVEVAFYLTLPLLARFVLGPRRQRPIRVIDVTDAALARPHGRRAMRQRRRMRDGWRAGSAAVWLRDWRPAVVLAALAVIAIGWRVYYMDQSNLYKPQILWLPPFLDWFAGGMLLAWLRERTVAVPVTLRHIANAPGACWSLALAGYWLTTTKIGGPYGLQAATTAEGMTKHVLYLLIGLLLLTPAIFGDPDAGWRRFATGRVMSWLGRISFGVFLWHPMLIEAIRRLLDMPAFTGGFWITLVLTLLASLTAGHLSWKLVEEPAQRRFRHGFRRRPAPADSPAQSPTQAPAQSPTQAVVAAPLGAPALPG